MVGGKTVVLNRVHLQNPRVCRIQDDGWLTPSVLSLRFFFQKYLDKNRLGARSQLQTIENDSGAFRDQGGFSKRRTTFENGLFFFGRLLQYKSEKRVRRTGLLLITTRRKTKTKTLLKYWTCTASLAWAARQMHARRGETRQESVWEGTARLRNNFHSAAAAAAVQVNNLAGPKNISHTLSYCACTYIHIYVNFIYLYIELPIRPTTTLLYVIQGGA